MRVKVGNKWHDSNEEPVAIQVSTHEQQQIASMDRTVAPNGRYAVFPDAWSGNLEAMRDWVRGEGEQPPTLQRKLDEAHALLIWMMGILPEELAPPLHKAHQLEAERDALETRAREAESRVQALEFQQQNREGLVRRAIEMEEKHEPLVAHYHVLRRELSSCQSILHQLARSGEVTPAYAEDAKMALAEDHATSLARRDVEKQAEAFEAKEKELRRRGYGAIADEMAEEATQLRRQAEQAERSKEDAA